MLVARLTDLADQPNEVRDADGDKCVRSIVNEAAAASPVQPIVNLGQGFLCVVSYLQEVRKSYFD